MRHALFVVALMGLLCATAHGDPLDPNWVKWSQLPDMTPNGYDFSSEVLVPSTVADDFLCTDPRPITDIHWWGSYYISNPYDINSDHHLDPSFPAPNVAPVMPAITAGFSFGFYHDVPAGLSPNMPYSHPGGSITTSWIPMSLIQSNLHGIIDRNGNGILGDDGDEAVWQYNVELISPFEQVPGTIYWLSITAINVDAILNPNGIQWGWHESFEHWNDAAVQNGPPALWGLPYSVSWANLEVKDMAFELSVPEPATMALLGGGLALMAMRWRKRK